MRCELRYKQKQRIWNIWGVSSDTGRKEYQTSCLEGSWRNPSSWSVFHQLLCPSFVTTFPLCFIGQVFSSWERRLSYYWPHLSISNFIKTKDIEKNYVWCFFTHKSKASYYNMDAISLKSCCWDSLLLTNLLISSLTFCAASMLGRFKLCLCSSGGPLFIWGLGMGCVLQSWRICSMV